MARLIFQSHQVLLPDFLVALSKAVDQQFKEREDLAKDWHKLLL